MSDQSKRVTGRRVYDSTPSSRQAVKFMTAATIGSISLVSCGLTLTGTVLVLILSTPILVLFSPILVPAATVTVMAAAGLLFSGSCVAAVAAALWWMNRYVTGGAEQVDYAREKIAERGKDYGQRVERKAKETTNK